MSVTSQLRNRAGPLWEFFEENESYEGIESLTRILRATSTPGRPPYSGSYPYSVTGTAFSYAAHILLPRAKICATFPSLGKKAKQEFTIDGSKAIEAARDDWLPYWIHKELIDMLLSKAADLIANKKDIQLVAKGSIILAILEISVRCGCLPQPLLDAYGKYGDEGTTIEFYLERELQWKTLVDDVMTISKIFLKTIKSPGSSLHGVHFCHFGKSLHHSHAVGGADIDVTIVRRDTLSIVDFKTVLRPIENTVTRQILSYALLWNKRQDGHDVRLSTIGIYYSRSGELKEIMISAAIELAFPKLRTLSEARKRLGSSFSEYAEKVSLLTEQRSIPELRRVLGR